MILQRTTVAGFSVLAIAGLAAAGLFRNGFSVDSSPAAGLASPPRISPRKAETPSVLLGGRSVAVGMESVPPVRSAAQDKHVSFQASREAVAGLPIFPPNSTKVRFEGATGPDDRGLSHRAEVAEPAALSSAPDGQLSGPMVKTGRGVPPAGSDRPVSSASPSEASGGSGKSRELAPDSVAASLARNLTDQELSTLSDHQQVAILELGDTSVGPTAGEIPEPDSGIGAGFHRTYDPESNECLRATLGQDGFVQLSFLAALKRHQLEEVAGGSR